MKLQETELDATDRRILAHLQEHGRASNLELAEAAHLSPAQCNRRHRRLEERGLIRRYEARLAAPALGLGVTAFVHVTMERGHLREIPKFRSYVQSLAQVQECYAVSGDFDYMLKVATRDLKALSDFLLLTLMQLPGVNAVRSSVCLDEVKCTAALPLDA
jgi:Lrp/AsnC family transcriptional regulator, leucine-responsive regulatory protein